MYYITLCENLSLRNNFFAATKYIKLIVKILSIDARNSVNFITTPLKN